MFHNPQKWFLLRAVKNCKIECDYYKQEEQNKFPPKLEELNGIEMSDIVDCVMIAIRHTNKDDADRYQVLLNKLNEVF